MPSTIASQKSSDLDALGENFEKTRKGFIDFLLLDAKGFPLIVREAKSEDKNPLIGKEQARKFARSQNCRFGILSNGNLHYFWYLEEKMVRYPMRAGHQAPGHRRAKSNESWRWCRMDNR